jgi:hypothetical protein
MVEEVLAHLHQLLALLDRDFQEQLKDQVVLLLDLSVEGDYLQHED